VAATPLYADEHGLSPVVAADVRRFKLKGLKARKKIAQGNALG
jgi:hypothetical protein